MDARDDAPDEPARLVELQVADDPAPWAAAGFTVEDDLVRVVPVDIRLTGRTDGGPRGITGWTLAGVGVAGGSLDGLTTSTGTDVAGAPRSAGPPHPNGTTGLDHLVVLTPDLDRTIAACEAAGLELRRIRDTTMNGAPVRQAFFKIGSVVLEVVSGDIGIGIPAAEAPATFWGLAVDVDDLDDTAATLGDGLGRIKPAVQRGRRIATLRTREVDISVAIAAMDHRGDPVDRTAVDHDR